MRGQPKQRERWKRGVDAVNGALGEQVAQVYVAKYFPPESKAKMQALVANLLRRAIGERIDALAVDDAGDEDSARTRSSPRSSPRSAIRTSGRTTPRSK